MNTNLPPTLTATAGPADPAHDRSRRAAAGSAPVTRVERDFLGEKRIPAEAYWGIHTARAIENFPISRRAISDHPDLVVALAQVKQAAARANEELGIVAVPIARRIDEACEQIKQGRWHEQFVVDVIQGGAGTSTNMNANEVIANVAIELDGGVRGEYARIHPIDHVNRSQSTNDVYPTSVRLALSAALERMLVQLAALRAAFDRKADEFDEVLKVGRTQLQDAVPMTVGQEFRGWAVTLGEDIDRLRETLPLLAEVNLGATAIGTGVTADPAYADAVRRHLADISGRPVVTASDLVEATSDTGVFMTVSGVLKRAAMKLSKICNDLRLLASGPQAGLGELNLPPRQAGSSIMPGKVNPVIPEVVNQIAFAIAGADATVTMAAEGGQLQLNAFEPVIAHSLLQGTSWLEHGAWTLRVNCVEGITVNAKRLAAQVAASVGVVTALTPYIGYAAAASLAEQALATGADIADLVVAHGYMSREQVTERLAPGRLTSPHAYTGAIPIVPDPDDPPGLA